MDWIHCKYLVVIVNYGTPVDVIECLNSMVNEIQSMGASQVIVVDNCSPDDSFEFIHKHINAHQWQNWATIIKAPSNGGFSAGNNCAIKLALKAETPPDYIHLLNPDTVIEANAFTALQSFMVKNPKVGIAGSRQTIPSGDWNMAFRFPGILSELDRGLQLGFVSKYLKRFSVAMKMGNENQSVDWVSGASMVIRREVFETIGLMDETYFLYYEETDYSLNAARAGWATWHVPESVVFHKVGNSTKVTKTDTLRRIPSYVFDSKNYYFKKNYGLIYAISTNVLFILGLTFHKILNTLLLRRNADAPYLLRDSIRHCGHLINSKLGRVKGQ